MVSKPNQNLDGDTHVLMQGCRAEGPGQRLQRQHLRAGKGRTKRGGNAQRNPEGMHPIPTPHPAPTTLRPWWEEASDEPQPSRAVRIPWGGDPAGEESQVCHHPRGAPPLPSSSRRPHIHTQPPPPPTTTTNSKQPGREKCPLPPVGRVGAKSGLELGEDVAEKIDVTMVASTTPSAAA